MHRSLRQIALACAGLMLTTQAMAAQAGWRQVSIAGTTADAAPIPVALYYPTQAPARAIAMGPFTVRVAIQAPPDATFKGLLVLSHGTGGSELGHSSLAETLAQHGYLVAALRHPGDNWQDRWLLQESAARYFTERPQHVSRLIDALLGDPQWGDRIARDAQGPRIGALGHSAGGYTVLALAGGRPDLSRLASHCDSYRAEDPIFCAMGRTAQPISNPVLLPPPIPPLIDTRVRAVVALAPVGVVFGAQSLASIRIPTAIYAAEQDRFLVPRFHTEWIARNLPGAEFHQVPIAWHFAFMDPPSMPIPSEDGDIGANPPGFDRQAFLRQLQQELVQFFDKAFR
ncbi:MAG: dienelactone hydrolase [Rhodoferax sp.]|nr:dienelactone hydrolase [Rhodoferax sp.]